MVTVILDLIGLKCPWPSIKTRQALAKLQIGDRLDVRCTDPMSAIDIPHLVNDTRNRLIDSRCDGDALSFLIEKQST